MSRKAGVSEGELADLVALLYTDGRPLSKAVSRYKQSRFDEGDYRNDDFNEAKADLSTRQTKLRSALDILLHENNYEDNLTDEIWRNSYQPFHWVSEFYSIVAENGGFDVIIGNPPYVEYSKVKNSYTLQNYETMPCGDLYSFVIERAKTISKPESAISMIAPISLISADKFSILRKMLSDCGMLWYSSYSKRPGMLFDGIEK
ncbi:MAG: Eco57I restriction-modification methylase domain-containing protein [Deltaproteobacteria bacterium]|nr:Eco57I restriction-modification methylase domain-containing protein [Deltaproteobacteria bacterium]